MDKRSQNHPRSQNNIPSACAVSRISSPKHAVEAIHSSSTIHRLPSRMHPRHHNTKEHRRRRRRHHHHSSFVRRFSHRALILRHTCMHLPKKRPSAQQSCPKRLGNIAAQEITEKVSSRKRGNPADWQKHKYPKNQVNRPCIVWRLRTKKKAEGRGDVR